MHLVLTGWLLAQKPRDKNKIYSLHEPEVDCISKGKARVRYEFGTKISIAATNEEGFIVGTRSMPGYPYDGHTLANALDQVEVLTDSAHHWPWSIAAIAGMARRAHVC